MTKIEFILIFSIIIFCIASGVSAQVPLAFDDFEYMIDKNVSGSGAGFITNGPWTQVKTNQDGRNAGGYLYTVTSIPGFSGSFPGTASQRVLAIEAIPSEVMPGWYQTDLYLGLGQEGGPRTAVPANSWFQFWMYVNNSGSQLTDLKQGKWLYPSGDGTYPSVTSDWLVTITGVTSYLPFWFWPSVTSPADYFFMNRPPTADYLNDPEYPTNKNKLGNNQGADGLYGVLYPNRWYLVKTHIDISGTSPLAPSGQGVYEQWLKEVGGQWRKTTEWIGGVTPQFSWLIASQGHAALRMPTTLDGRTASSRGWFYMDDFVMATSEADLPVYGAAPPVDTTPPSAPSGVTVQ